LVPDRLYFVKKLHDYRGKWAPDFIWDNNDKKYQVFWQIKKCFRFVAEEVLKENPRIKKLTVGLIK
jgi:hypothetical protein